MNVIYYELPEYGDDFLMHHGIKGMKWGIRRTAEQLGHFTKRVYKTGKDTYNKVAPKIKAHREKRIEKAKQKAILSGDYAEIMKYRERMTDEELKRAYSRMDTTKKMTDIARDNAQKSIERGVKTVETIARVGTAVVNIRKASSDLQKQKAEKAESYKKRKEALDPIDKKTRDKIEGLAAQAMTQIMNDPNEGSYKERSKKARQVHDEMTSAFRYDTVGGRVKSGINKGTKVATEKVLNTHKKSEDEVYDYIKKRMGRG